MLELDVATALLLLSWLLLLLPVAVLLALGSAKFLATRFWVAGGLLSGAGVSLLVEVSPALPLAGSVLAHLLILGGLGLAASALKAAKQLAAVSFWVAVGFLFLFAMMEAYFAIVSLPPLGWAFGVSPAVAQVHAIAWPLPLLVAVGAAMGNVAFIGLVLDNQHARGLAKMRGLAEEEERERMAEVLAHMDRASNLTVISSSLGLQLGPPLAAIESHTRLLKQRAEEGAPADAIVQELDEVVGEVRRCAQVVDQVRQFIKPPPLQPAMVDVQALAKEVWELLRQEAQQQGVQVEFAAEGQGLPAFMDRVRGAQVIMNILRSAAEGKLLGATGPIRVAFRRSVGEVEMSFHIPWPAAAHGEGEAMAAPLAAHAAVFDSRKLAAAETLAQFCAKIVVRGPSPLGCEVILSFRGSPAEARLETA